MTNRLNQKKAKCVYCFYCIRRREDNENPPHFLHEIKTKGYHVIGVDVFRRKLLRFHSNKRSNRSLILFFIAIVTKTGTYKQKIT